jgi:L-lactate dehydrogenase (cytochrome)
MIISYQELAKHTSKDDIWIVIEGIVYDVSNFLDEHPGGPAIILLRGGKIAT